MCDILLSWAGCPEDWNYYINIFCITCLLSYALVLCIILHGYWLRNASGVEAKIYLGIFAYSLINILYNLFVMLKMHWFGIEVMFNLYTVALFITLSFVAEYWAREIETYVDAVYSARYYIIPSFSSVIVICAFMTFLLDIPRSIFLDVQYVNWLVCSIVTSFFYAMKGKYLVQSSSKTYLYVLLAYVMGSLVYILGFIIMIAMGKDLLPRIIAYIIFACAGHFTAWMFYIFSPNRQVLCS